MNILVDLCWKWDKWLSSDPLSRDCTTPGLLFQDRFCRDLHLNLKYSKSDFIVHSEMEHSEKSFEKQSMKAKRLDVCMDCYEGWQDLNHVSGSAGEHTRSGP